MMGGECTGTGELSPMTNVCPSHVNTIETAQGTYVWKSDDNYPLAVSSHCSILTSCHCFDLCSRGLFSLPSRQLYRKDDMSNHVAHLQLETPTQNFAVIMQPEAQLIRDDVIVSFLILEQRESLKRT